MKKALVIIAVLFFATHSLKAQQISELENEKQAVTNTVLDYGIGYYSGDGERMERALHPELNKVVVAKIKPDGNSILQYSTVSGLVEMSRGKAGLLEESRRKVSVVVYDVEGNSACAKINSAQFNDYVQLVKVDGKWKIINVLWTFGPDSKSKPVVAGFNPEAEAEAIKKCASDLTGGILEGDYAKFEKSIHPEFNFVQISTFPSTGRPYISKLGAGLLSELVKGKMTAAAENLRTSEIKVFDSADGYAYVKVSSPATTFYVQMAKIGDKWNAINTLAARIPAPKK